ncbi:hypothetical protein LENED_006688 [Lentinula edodes]|uniref:Uncharacterized protein n=1 Tax=Lentinula edodes TaxID=5353 RepID=A0A1Q3ECF6_LENED|nr:hypothetical protein LENED_006688 [Lentinula edodes]
MVGRAQDVPAQAKIPCRPLLCAGSVGSTSIYTALIFGKHKYWLPFIVPPLPSFHIYQQPRWFAFVCLLLGLLANSYSIFFFNYPCITSGPIDFTTCLERSLVNCVWIRKPLVKRFNCVSSVLHEILIIPSPSPSQQSLLTSSQRPLSNVLNLDVAPNRHLALFCAALPLGGYTSCLCIAYASWWQRHCRE